MRLLSFLLAFLFSVCSFASGLSAPFNGSRFTGFTQPSTVVEYDSTMDHNVKLVDLSGSNYATYSEDFNSWTKTNLTVSTNTARDPRFNTLTVDTLVEANDVGQQHSVHQSISLTSGVKYTFSVYFKAINRTWISLYVGTDAFQTFCDSTMGNTGTTSSGAIAKNQSLGSGWYRCSMQFTATATAARDLYVYIAEQDNDTTFNGAGQNSVYLWGGQLALTDEWRPGPGVYHATNAVNKPLFDIDQDGEEYVNISNSMFQDGSGRVIQSNNLYYEPYYEHPAHDALNVFDGDFTITAVISLTFENLYVFDSIFNYGNRPGGNIAGAYFWFTYAAGADFVLDLYNNGGEVEAEGSTTFDSNVAFVGQAVRSNNIVTVYVDGKPGIPVDVTGYGIDTAEPFYFGWSGDGQPFDNNIIYFRLDAAALTQGELSRQRDIFRGAYAGSGSSNVGNIFSRPLDDWASHTSYLGANYLVGAAADTPRMGGDGGGLLIENETIPLLPYSDILDWSTDSIVRDDNAWSVAINDRYWQLIVTPTGLSPMVKISETAVDGLHNVYKESITAPGTMYTFSVHAKKIPAGRDWIWLANYVSDPPPAVGAFFNIDKKVIGTADIGVTPFMETLDNDWVRIGITTVSTADDFWTVALADDTPDAHYLGDGRDAVWLWGAQLEAGPQATSPVVRYIDVGVTRRADTMTMAPWQLTKNMGQGNPIFTMLFDNDVCNTAPCNQYTSEVGSNTFTVNGETSHISTHSYGDYFLFNGTDAWLSLAHGSAGAFYPTGDFTIAAIVTPDVVAGTRTIFSTYGSGGTGGYRLYGSNADVNFYTETGLGNTTCTKAVSLVANKTSLITVSFTKGAGATDSTCNIYVDGRSVGTSAVMRYPGARDAGVGIGATAVGEDFFDGKIHYIGYHNDALTQAQHDANYASLKQADALPLLLGNSYEHKKLYLDFDTKCGWSSLSNMGATAREIFSISGDTGTSDNSTNRIRIYVNTNGKLYASIYPKDENDERFMSTAVHSDWDKWHSHKIMWDLADLTRSRFTTEGVYATLDATMTGAKNIEFTDTLIRPGQDYSGTVSGNCTIRNLRLRSSQ